MIAQEEQYIVDTEGNKTAVVLSVAAYEALLQKIAELQADLHDLAVVAERRGEAELTLAELQTELEQDGVI